MFAMFAREHRCRGRRSARAEECCGRAWCGLAKHCRRESWEAAERAVRTSDLLLVIGTSGVVYPAAGLARLGKRVVEINVAATAAFATTSTKYCKARPAKFCRD